MKSYKSGAKLGTNGLVIKFSLVGLKVGPEVGPEVGSEVDEFKGSESKLFMLKVIK